MEKTKDDIIKIIRNKISQGIWCENEAEMAIEYVNKFPPTATLTEIAKDIPPLWAYCWARHIGDKHIMLWRFNLRMKQLNGRSVYAMY